MATRYNTHTLVARGNGVVRIVRRLRSPDNVSPPGSDSGSRWNRDYRAILVLNVLVAGKTRVVDILDRVVAVRGANSLQLALVSAVDRYLLEDCMCGREGHEACEGDCDLHSEYSYLVEIISLSHAGSDMSQKIFESQVFWNSRFIGRQTWSQDPVLENKCGQRGSSIRVNIGEPHRTDHVAHYEVLQLSPRSIPTAPSLILILTTTHRANDRT